MKKPRPKPISIRPKSQAIRDKYIAMGGAKWFNLYFEVEVMKDQCAKTGEGSVAQQGEK